MMMKLKTIRVAIKAGLTIQASFILFLLVCSIIKSIEITMIEKQESPKTNKSPAILPVYSQKVFFCMVYNLFEIV